MTNLGNIGYPNESGNYSYPVKDGKVILIPNTVNLAKIDTLPKKLNIEQNNSNKINFFNIFQIIITILLILLLIYVLYTLYEKITFIESNFNSSVKTIVDDNLQLNFNKMIDDKILNSSKQFDDNIMSKINDDVIPQIYNDASNAFLSSNTSAISINNDFPMMSKNTLICDDISNITTCTCLFDNCNQLSHFKNYLFVDRPIGFNEFNNYIYSGNIIPMNIDENNIRITNQFTISFHINITKTISENRILFNWGGDNNHLNKYPRLIIRGDDDNDYNGRYKNSLEIQFSHLGPNGTFNITSDVRDNCLDNIPLHKWNHIMIMGNGKLISFYMNGKFIKSTATQQDVKIGDPDQWISIGKPFNDNTGKNPYGILLAKFRWFSDVIPNEYIQFYANEYIQR